MAEGLSLKQKFDLSARVDAYSFAVSVADMERISRALDLLERCERQAEISPKPVSSGSELYR